MRLSKYIVLFALLLLMTGTFIFIKQSIQKSEQPKEQNLVSSNSKAPQNQQIHISSGEIPSFPLNLHPGYVIHVFAKGLGSPRDLVFSPGGTMLVSNTNSNQVFALPDKNNDGTSDTNKVIVIGENHAHGLAFYNGKLYIADVNRVVRYNWDEANLSATFDKVLFSLPDNGDHNNRTITFDNSGRMFVSVGSTCNVCRETPQQGGSVWVSDKDGNNPHVFATGLRNAAFLQINPKTNDLWSTEMGRDYLGDDIPPDEINIIRENQNYGWPNCYGDKIHDTNFDKSSNNPCNSTQSPIFQIPAHSAPLGLTFINSTEFPEDLQGDLLVSYHGSWNRSVPDGYKVVHLKVNGNSITSSEDFISGFAPSSTLNVPGNAVNKAPGRPVDLIFDKNGNLYMSDDKGGFVYIIQKSSK